MNERICFECEHSGPYRGDYSITWTFARPKVIKERAMPVELYAAVCSVCRQWWGWTIFLDKAKKLARVMSKIGCPRCKYRGKGKKQKRMRKALEG